MVAAFLGWQAVEDLRHKSIRMDGVIIFSVLGILLQVGCRESWGECVMKLLLGCIPGVVMLILSVVWKGQIGEGDGFIFLVVGLYLGGLFTGVVCYVSLVLVAIIGVILWFWRRYSKQEQSNYPFVPFVFAAFIILKVWREIV